MHYVGKNIITWNYLIIVNLDSLGELSQEFFSLDLSKLESSIMTIPFHEQIGLNQNEIEPTYLEQILLRTGSKKDDKVSDSVAVEKELTKNMLNILTLKSTNENSADVKEENSNPGLTSVSIEENLQPEKTTSVSSAPLEQRQKRRQRVSTKSLESSVTKPGDTSEKDDLKFIEDLDKESKPSDTQTVFENSQESKVVAVKLKSEETQNLEDWLDDFLDD